MTDVELKSKAVRGAAWGGVSSIVLRMGSLVVGIVLARILTPEQFGVYAVALTVQSILMTVADLGLSADLIRSEEPEKIAPTVATLGMVSGAVTTALAIASSGFVAQVLGSEAAAPAIAVLALTLFLAGVSIVPYAMLLRRFQQRELFWIGVVDFVVSTVVTLLLVFAGFGVMGLAIGRVSAQVVSSALQFVLAKERPRYGLDRERVRPVLAFGLPIATANLLAWGLLNVDNIVLVRIAGATALGYYVLAFNISNWPMSALSQSVRAIALPYFSRTDDASSSLARVTALGWAGALPAGAVLAVVSAPLISVLYGERWLTSAPVLSALGVFGALRVLFDIFNGFLYARGHARPVLWVQIAWLLALVVGMVLATTSFGIVGAAWVHVVVALVVILPMYLIALRRCGVRLGALLRGAVWPTVATVPAFAVAGLAVALIGSALPALLVGGFAAVAVYLAVVWRWGKRELRAMSA
ncbi:lipopolysaccharide biosynthesis protein [Microbacterium oryzae]|uniref:Uncharacterized protein n=1 Tax=Microbacterium oryzae TaxID=743009 RepID=A0A6I6DSA9_9MICO|nr:oligosaccharide flippase family protein [Microbacterium oryzae]QGU27835.1 hypothetical protein D7D94_09310 [Microbacterium oryzae]